MAGNPFFSPIESVTVWYWRKNDATRWIRPHGPPPRGHLPEKC